MDSYYVGVAFIHFQMVDFNRFVQVNFFTCFIMADLVISKRWISEFQRLVPRNNDRGIDCLGVCVKRLTGGN